jgi:hypothetical protein
MAKSGIPQSKPTVDQMFSHRMLLGEQKTQKNGAKSTAEGYRGRGLAVLGDGLATYY